MMYCSTFDESKKKQQHVKVSPKHKNTYKDETFESTKCIKCIQSDHEPFAFS